LPERNASRNEPQRNDRRKTHNKLMSDDSFAHLFPDQVMSVTGGKVSPVWSSASKRSAPKRVTRSGRICDWLNRRVCRGAVIKG
jgi:hypothetical protein